MSRFLFVCRDRGTALGKRPGEEGAVLLELPLLVMERAQKAVLEMLCFVARETEARAGQKLLYELVQ